MEISYNYHTYWKDKFSGSFFSTRFPTRSVMIFFCFAGKLARSGERVKHSSLRAGFAAQQKRVYNTTRLKSGEKTCRKNWPPNDADLSRGERSTCFYWVSTSGSQNGHQFDELNGEEGRHKQKNSKTFKTVFSFTILNKNYRNCVTSKENFGIVFAI